MYVGSYVVNLFKHAMIGKTAVRSYPTLCLKRQVAKLASGLFHSGPD